MKTGKLVETLINCAASTEIYTMLTKFLIQIEI